MANAVITGNQNTTWLMNYLKSSTKQYPELSKIEEKKLIKKYKKDRETLNKLLQLHNVKLVFNMAKKYMSKTNDYDGLVQDGLVGLAEAASRFDITKDIKFCTYAYIWIKKYMTMNFYGKQVEVDKRSMSLDMSSTASSIKSNNGNEVTFENYVNEYIDPSCNVKSINQELSSNEQTEICKNLINELEHDNSLSATDKEIFVEMFYNKEKPRDLAEKYDKTIKDITMIKVNVLSKLKDILVNDYHINSYADLNW